MTQTDPSIIMQLQSPHIMTPYELLMQANQIRLMRARADLVQAQAAALEASRPPQSPTQGYQPSQPQSATVSDDDRILGSFARARREYPDFDEVTKANAYLPRSDAMNSVMRSPEEDFAALDYWLAKNPAEARRIFEVTKVPDGATQSQIDAAKACAWNEVHKIQQQLYSDAAAASAQQPIPEANESLTATRQAAQQGDVFAQYNLGLSYFAGLGVPKDYVEAGRWFRKSAEQGNARAQTFMAVLYGQGNGVPQDPTEAARWMLKAAEQGEDTAQAAVGELYARGDGVPQDYVLAHMWVNLATSHATGEDRQKLATLRDTIAGQMTAQQIAEAQHLAREWKPKNGGDPGGKPMN
jgi:TPR repeat protein